MQFPQDKENTQEIDRDIAAFFSLLDFYTGYKPKCTQAIKFAQLQVSPTVFIESIKTQTIKDQKEELEGDIPTTTPKESNGNPQNLENPKDQKDQESYKLWNQLGDSIWQLIPAIERNIERLYDIQEELSQNTTEGEGEIPKTPSQTSHIEEEFYSTLNALIMNLALTITLTNSIASISENFTRTEINLEQINGVLQNITDLKNRKDLEHPIHTINQEIANM
jgi:predicted  nucleic acid-binding Zn-ribbon protein